MKLCIKKGLSDFGGGPNHSERGKSRVLICLEVILAGGQKDASVVRFKSSRNHVRVK